MLGVKVFTVVVYMIPLGNAGYMLKYNMPGRRSFFQKFILFQLFIAWLLHFFLFFPGNLCGRHHCSLKALPTLNMNGGGGGDWCFLPQCLIWSECGLTLCCDLMLNFLLS